MRFPRSAPPKCRVSHFAPGFLQHVAGFDDTNLVQKEYNAAYYGRGT